MVAVAAPAKTSEQLLEDARWLCKHVLKGRLRFEVDGRYDPKLGRSVAVYRIFRRHTGFVAMRSSPEGLVRYLESQRT